jgi:hypothetical protein
VSSLIFYTDPDQALVVTDTLAVNPDGSPFVFTSKAHYIPHLRTIIAGTGVGGFSVDWFLRANSRMLLRGIENLDFHAPAALRDLWSSYIIEYSLTSGSTTTVYHFGFSEDSGEIAAFAYRSTNNFVSERLAYGTGVKPECSVPEGNLYEHLQTMMLEQRSIQAGIPASERIYIGGEAMAIHLTAEACTYSTLFAFPDFHDQSRMAFGAFPGAR